MNKRRVPLQPQGCKSIYQTEGAGEHLLLKHCCLWWLMIATLSSTIPVGVGGDAEEVGLVKSDREGEGVLGVDGGEM